MIKPRLCEHPGEPCERIASHVRVIADAGQPTEWRYDAGRFCQEHAGEALKRTENYNPRVKVTLERIW